MSIEDYYYLVRRYRRAILDTSDYLREKLCLTEAAIDEVADSWNDAEYIKFKEAFAADKDKILILLEIINAFEEYLSMVERLLRPDISI